MVLAVAAIDRGDHKRLRTWLLTTALLGAVFISGQVYEFQTFVKEGMGFTTQLGVARPSTRSPASTACTSRIGIIMLVSTVVLSLRGRIPHERAESVEIVGLYWHFVDVVWILIFTVVYLIE